MFSPKNNNKPLTTTFSVDPNFGQDFIHTMKDELSSSSNNTPGESSFLPKNPSTQKINSNTLLEKSSSPFLDATEKIPTIQIKNEASLSDNNNEQKKILDSSTSNQTVSSENPIKNDFFVENEENISTNNSILKKILLILIITLTVALLVAGGYYFWIKNNSNKQSGGNPSTQNTPTNESIEEKIVITPIAEKYSPEKPNFLSINIETTSSEQIKGLITATATETKNIQTKKPFEFVITDTNNVPISFQIFSIASDLSLSSELLTNLNENFSFYIYNDPASGNRTGIAIEIKNKELISSEMLKEESVILQKLSFLFLESPSPKEQLSFKSGEYGGAQIRYVNLDTENLTSIDYTIYNNKLILATSKEAMRSIIDKINASL